MKDTLKFLKELCANNNREWFGENKERYKVIKGRVDEFTTRLLAALCSIDPKCNTLTPSDCQYRIYRDTRFSTDKTPYKRHIGIYANPNGGKKSQLGGYYFHIEPGNSFVATGIWYPPSPVIKALRQDIFDNIEEYLEIIRNPEFTQYVDEIGEDLLKTAPKGFPKDWQYIELLRPRSFTAVSNIPDSVIKSPDLLAEVIKRFAAMKPYNDFLNYTFEEKPDLPKFY